MSLQIVIPPPVKGLSKERMERVNKAFRSFYNDVVSSLKTICSLVEVDAKGKVSIKGEIKQGSKDEKGCCCIAKLVNSKHANRIRIRIKIKQSVTEPDSVNDGFLQPVGEGMHGPPAPSSGTAATVHVNLLERRVEMRKGKKVDVERFIILAHELCGHAVLLNEGTHREFGPPLVKGEPPNHEIDAVRIENDIRGEHGLPPRPAYGHNRTQKK